MRIRRILLVFFALFYSGVASAKYTACTITIQSDEERTLFFKHMPPNEFQFHELTKWGYGSNPKSNWLQNACKSGLKCDVLMISGHFGGKFFAYPDTGVEITMKQLQRLACDRKCPGLLNHPTEVFMFACNTLASKDRDGRSLQEYLKTLMDDQHSRVESEYAVQLRYGNYGLSYRQQMRGIFSGVPNLYGFRSRSPSGRTIEGKLDRYLASRGDYADWLQNQSVNQLSSGLSSVQNGDFKKQMACFRGDQCSGACPNDDDASRFEQLCRLTDPKRPNDDKIRMISQFAENHDFLTYIDEIKDLFWKTPNDPVWDKVRKSAMAKASLLNLISELEGFPIVANNMSEFAYHMGWISDPQIKAQRNLLLKTLWIPNMKGPDRDLACQIRRGGAVHPDPKIQAIIVASCPKN